MFFMFITTEFPYYVIDLLAESVKATLSIAFAAIASYLIIIFLYFKVKIWVAK